MKFTHLQRKTISLIVLAAFVGLLHFWATPAPAATRTGNSETTIAQGNSGGPNFIEEESGSTRGIQKAKKFPWLFIGLGVVAVGVALYFLVINKPKFTLTVTLGAGCTGTPAASGTYKEGTAVSYNYTPLAGYGSLQVKVDGAAVPASGTITMDKDKALTVTAEMDILTNTYWGGTDSDSHYYIYRFYPDGKFGYTSPTGTFGTDGNSWVLTGVHILISINNGYSFREGTISGNTMSGNAWNIVGHNWTWTATKLGYLTSFQAEKDSRLSGLGASANIVADNDHAGVKSDTNQ
jgi:hypothetical protein